MHSPLTLALIDADRRHLVRAATRLLGPAEAEDAVQDAYLRALEADPGALDVAQAWLLTVVRHLAIDRLRRARWMQHWRAEMQAGDDASAATAPSAEQDAALAQEAANALRMIAAHVSPADGAALLLHEVFELSHAEIADASGRSEAGSRQQLRRTRLRLKQAGERPGDAGEAGEETVLRLYLHALQARDPRGLWAMLRQPPITAVARRSAPIAEANAARPLATSGITQVDGQFGLVLSLDGVTLCVLPLGVRPEGDAEPMAADGAFCRQR